MKNKSFRTRLLRLSLAILIFCQFIQFDSSQQPESLPGEWKYYSHVFRKANRYGNDEINLIKKSLLVFTENKIYFTETGLADTCFYSGLVLRQFFERENKEVTYFQDGPLALIYTKDQLSKFKRVDLTTTKNGFGTFYLNGDTLILNSTGGPTIYFTRFSGL